MYVELMTTQLQRSRDKYLLRNVSHIKGNRSKSHERDRENRDLLCAQILCIPTIRIVRSRSQVTNLNGEEVNTVN